MAIPCGGADTANVENMTWLLINVAFPTIESPGKSGGLPRQCAHWLAMTCVLFGAVQTFKLQFIIQYTPCVVHAGGILSKTKGLPEGLGHPLDPPLGEGTLQSGTLQESQERIFLRNQVIHIRLAARAALRQLQLV